MSFHQQIEDIPLVGFYRFDGGWWVRHATTHRTLGVVTHLSTGWRWYAWPTAQYQTAQPTRKAACAALVAWWREHDAERLTAPVEREVSA